MMGTKKKRGHRTMTQITLKIDGMQCGMCESHMNDAVRADISGKESDLLPFQG